MKTSGLLLSMSIFTVVTLVLVITTIANADVHVRGHYRSNGTYVQPHYRSNPDGIRSNNWSSRGNVNPYTGKRGTKRFSTMSNINVPSYRDSQTLPYVPEHISLPKRIGMPNPTPMPTFPSHESLL